VMKSVLDNSGGCLLDGADISGAADTLRALVGYAVPDLNTGNIFDASGNYAGWEDPYTGNLYDNEGAWSSWDSHYQQVFSNSYFSEVSSSPISAGPYAGGNQNPNNPGYVAPGVGPQPNPENLAVGAPPFTVK